MSILLPVGEGGEAVEETAGRIVRALYEDAGMREVLAAPPESAGRAYALSSDLEGPPPAAHVPLLIPELGALSIPAPAGGRAAVEALIREVAPGAQVREVGEYRASEEAPPGGGE